MKNYADTMIATQGALSDAQLDEVASKFRNIEGVGKFTRSQRIPRVIWISYNTGKVKALSILNQFTQLGFKARLIDM